MKGNLYKTEEGWFVIFDQRTMQDPSAEDGMLPLHPEYQRILPLDLNLDGKEVEFEISMYDGKSHISNAWNGYAKLVDSSHVSEETKYTEKQLREAMDDACIKGFNNNLGLRFNHLYRKDYIDKYIQSLKQLKKD